jgi:hypothetical protein
MTHSISADLLDRLISVKPEAIELAFRQFSTQELGDGGATSVSDVALGITLRGLGVVTIARMTRTELEVASTFLDAFPKSGTGPLPQVYTAATCQPFHRLLCHTLGNYRSTLTKLKKASEIADKKTIAYSVWHYAYLLFVIAYSRMFRLHMESLSGTLNLDISRESTAVNADSGNADAKPSDGETDDDEEEDEELDALKSLVKTNAAKGFQKWVRIQASYMASLDTLTRFCATPYVSEVTFRLVAVNRNSEKYPTWPDVKTFISKIFPQDQSHAANEAMELLELYITKYEPGDRRRKMLQKFRQIIEGHIGTFQGCVHCEAAWVALKVFVKLAKISDKELIDIINVKSSS